MADKQLKGNDRYSLPAVREGDTYCAPWCGRGCTIQEHDRAAAGAMTTAAALSQATGLDWRPRHWENLGWHYEARLSGAQVYPGFNNSNFTCIINSALSVVGHGDTAVEAFEDARTHLRDKMVQLARELNTLGGLK